MNFKTTNTMLHSGYKTKYEKSMYKDGKKKTLCIYEVENGYIVKKEEIKENDEGHMDYENMETKVYITYQDPMEEEKKDDKEMKEGGDIKKAIESLY